MTVKEFLKAEAERAERLKALRRKPMTRAELRFYFELRESRAS